MDNRREKHKLRPAQLCFSDGVHNVVNSTQRVFMNQSGRVGEFLSQLSGQCHS